MLPQILFSAEQLLESLAQKPAPVLLDARFDLADPDAGQRAYLANHIPGAHYAHLDRDLSGTKTGHNGRHPLPAFGSFCQTAAGWGVGPSSQVVIYDAQGSMFAARAFWMLRQIGVRSVAVLDGGLQAWLAINGPLHQAVPPPSDAAWPEQSAAGWHNIVQVQELASVVTERFLLDARIPERYRGDVEPLDAVAGHIPGAHNRFFKLNLRDDGRFKPASTLKTEFNTLLGATPPQDVIHQCGSGVTACHNLLAMEVAGLTGSRLYPGSWSEWCSDPLRPVVRGSQPMPN